MILRVLGCHGPYPCPDGATSGYLLSLPGGDALLDCGAGVLGKLIALIDPASLTAVLLSHLHYDHMSDLYALKYYLDRMGETLPVYLPRAAMDTPVARTLQGGALSARPLEELRELAGARVECLPVRHPVPANAVRIAADGKTLVYTGDTNVFAPLDAFCESADLLVADGALTSAQWTDAAPHMSARHAGELAARAGVGRLIVTHLIPENAPGVLLAEAREAFAGALLAAPGQVLTV